MTMTASRLVLAAQAAARAEQTAAQATQPLAQEFRWRAAQALRERYPELSRKFLDTTRDGPAVGQIR